MQWFFKTEVLKLLELQSSVEVRRLFAESQEKNHKIEQKWIPPLGCWDCFFILKFMPTQSRIQKKEKKDQRPSQ